MDTMTMEFMKNVNNAIILGFHFKTNIILAKLAYLSTIQLNACLVQKVI